MPKCDVVSSFPGEKKLERRERERERETDTIIVSQQWFIQ